MEVPPITYSLTEQNLIEPEQRPLKTIELVYCLLGNGMPPSFHYPWDDVEITDVASFNVSAKFQLHH